MTRSDLRFPLATGSPVGTSHFCFSLLLHLLLRLFCQDFVGCSLVFLLVAVSGVFSLLLRLPPWFCTSLCWGGVLRSIFSVFSFRSTVLDYFVTLLLPVLCLSYVFLRGVFAGSFILLGILPFVYLFLLPVFLPRIVPLGFVLPALFTALSVDSSSPLCVVVVLLVSALDPSFASSFLVRLSSVTFFSFSVHFAFLIPFFGFFMWFLVTSLL